MEPLSAVILIVLGTYVAAWAARRALPVVLAAGVLYLGWEHVIAGVLCVLAVGLLLLLLWMDAPGLREIESGARSGRGRSLP